MVTARLAHVIRFITPGIQEQHGKAADDQDRFRRRAWRPVPVALTRRKSKPAAREVTAIRGGVIALAEAADAFLSSPQAASPNARRAYADVMDCLVAELGLRGGLPSPALPGSGPWGRPSASQLFGLSAFPSRLRLPGGWCGQLPRSPRRRQSGCTAPRTGA